MTDFARIKAEALLRTQAEDARSEARLAKRRERREAVASAKTRQRRGGRPAPKTGVVKITRSTGSVEEVEQSRKAANLVIRDGHREQRLLERRMARQAT